MEKVTLQAIEKRASFEGASERDTGAVLMKQRRITQDELFVKDAFLVLRALCKLSMKPLTVESERLGVSETASNFVGHARGT